MLAAIEFNDQLRAEAGKVDDISSSRYLTTEAPSAQATGLQQRPENPFSFGRRSAQLLCEFLY